MVAYSSKPPGDSLPSERSQSSCKDFHLIRTGPHSIISLLINSESGDLTLITSAKPLTLAIQCILSGEWHPLFTEPSHTHEKGIIWSVYASGWDGWVVEGGEVGTSGASLEFCTSYLLCARVWWYISYESYPHRTHLLTRVVDMQQTIITPWDVFYNRDTFNVHK